jgi:ketosteroid isomerase-like protein
MSSKNVERLRAVYADWARGNFRAGQDLFAPDVTLVTFTSEGDALTYHTPAGVASWLRDFLQNWRDLQVEAHEFFEEQDRVLALGHQRAKGRQSGVQVDMPVFTVWTFRDVQVVRLHFLRDRGEAFRAAGLDE